ncbi:MAG: electron transport complex subunit RsxC [Ignavibacteriaceae bacterium]|nr:electron transport complex subunit RsxC [Ignavibacteriaceae bacterium]
MFQKLLTFVGGIHPGENKNFTENLEIEEMPLPKSVYIPLSQHIGKPATALVKKGSIVKEGEVIATAEGFISSPIHSPVAGTVLKITTGANLSGVPKEYIEIQVNPEGEKVFMEPVDWQNNDKKTIINRIKEAGIVGQGGAAFPTFVKLSPPPGKTIDYLVINGAECEPYLTRDYRLMLERTSDLIEGIRILMKAAGVPKAIIGIENNKPLAIQKVTEAAKAYPEIQVATLKTKYPQGAEKMLIFAGTGRKVPPGKLPLDVGVIVQNIGTSLSVYDAVVKGIPSITSVMTVTGKGITTPKNLLVRVGTQLAEVINYCGGLKPEAVKVISGGPMMGIAQYDFNAPVMKASSGLLVLASSEINEAVETPCLRCGKCVEVCPLNLLPTRLAKLTQMGKFEDAEEYGVTVCMECGSCAYECPANIPLVQWIKLGKKEVSKIQRARKSS